MSVSHVNMVTACGARLLKRDHHAPTEKHTLMYSGDKYKQIEYSILMFTKKRARQERVRDWVSC